MTPGEIQAARLYVNTQIQHGRRIHATAGTGPAGTVTRRELCERLGLTNEQAKNILMQFKADPTARRLFE